MLEFLRRENPKLFYSKFSKTKRKCAPADTNPYVFFQHFKTLCEQNVPQIPEELESCVFEELDAPIIKYEIFDSIDELKKNKSLGTDGILNEFLSNSKISLSISYVYYLTVF
jgi:hypothetical protein